MAFKINSITKSKDEQEEKNRLAGYEALASKQGKPREQTTTVSTKPAQSTTATKPKTSYNDYSTVGQITGGKTTTTPQKPNQQATTTTKQKTTPVSDFDSYSKITTGKENTKDGKSRMGLTVGSGIEGWASGNVGTAAELLDDEKARQSLNERMRELQTDLIDATEKNQGNRRIQTMQAINMLQKEIDNLEKQKAGTSYDRSYDRRLASLQDELRNAEATGDTYHIQRAKREIAKLQGEKALASTGFTDLITQRMDAIKRGDAAEANRILKEIERREEIDTKINVRNTDAKLQASDKLRQISIDLRKQSEQHREEAKDGLSVGGQLAVDVFSNVTENAMDMLTFGKLGLGKLGFGARVFGQSATEAYQWGQENGKPVTQQQRLEYAASQTLIEEATEAMWNVAGPLARTYGAGTFDDMTTRWITQAVEKLRASDSVKRFVGQGLQFGVSSLTEALEEGASDFFNYRFQTRTLYGADPQTFDEMWSELGKDMLLGAMSGGIFSGVGYVQGDRYNLAEERTNLLVSNNTKALQRAQAAQTRAEKGLERAQAKRDTQALATAAKAANKANELWRKAEQQSKAGIDTAYARYMVAKQNNSKYTDVYKQGVFDALDSAIEVGHEVNQHFGVPETAAMTAKQVAEQAAEVRAQNEDATVMLPSDTIIMDRLGLPLDEAGALNDTFTKLINGEELTTDEWKALDPANKSVQKVFTELTGVQFPGDVSDEQARFIYANAPQIMEREREKRGIEMSKSEQAERLGSAVNTAVNEARPNYVASYNEFANAVQAQFPNISEPEIRQAFDEYLKVNGQTDVQMEQADEEAPAPAAESSTIDTLDADTAAIVDEMRDALSNGNRWVYNGLLYRVDENGDGTYTATVRSAAGRGNNNRAMRRSVFGSREDAIEGLVRFATQNNAFQAEEAAAPAETPATEEVPSGQTTREDALAKIREILTNAKFMGSESAMETLINLYEDGQDPEAYVGLAVNGYAYGVDGNITDQEWRQTVRGQIINISPENITAEQLQGAYEAGKADAPILRERQSGATEGDTAQGENDQGELTEEAPKTNAPAPTEQTPETQSGSTETPVAPGDLFNPDRIYNGGLQGAVDTVMNNPAVAGIVGKMPSADDMPKTAQETGKKDGKSGKNQPTEKAPTATPNETTEKAPTTQSEAPTQDSSTPADTGLTETQGDGTITAEASEPTNVESQAENGEAKEDTNGSEVEEVPDERGVLQSDTAGETTGGLLDGVQTEDVQGAESDGRSVPDSQEPGRGSSGHASQTDGSGSTGVRGTGVHQSGDIRGELSEKPPASESTDKPAAEKKPTEQKPTKKEPEAAPAPEKKPDMPNAAGVSAEPSADPRGVSFVIPESGLDLPDKPADRLAANIKAIEILKDIQKTGRPATAEEQVALSKYVGWGGLQLAFDKWAIGQWAEVRSRLRELLTEEEFEAAAQSTQNAHYTSIEVVRAMYDILGQLGFQGGRMMEPAVGTGNFIGAMPAALRGKPYNWTAVELDPITAGIAQALYPTVDVLNQGFQDAPIPKNYMDVVITNVPFAPTPVTDRTFPNVATRSLHNYFIAKSVESTRPGGIVIVITSRYTMDAKNQMFRRYISERADLLGAIRLPNTAFKSNADTDVVTDILIFKRRADGTPYSGETFITTGQPDGIAPPAWAAGKSDAQVNEYFYTHPEMVLGVRTSSVRNNGDADRAEKNSSERWVSFNPLETDMSLGDQIRNAAKRITGKMDYPEKPTPEQITNTAIGKKHQQEKRRPGSHVAKDGKIYRVTTDGMAERIDLSKAEAKKIGALMLIKERARQLLEMQQRGDKPANISKLRKELNTLYDDFVNAYGPINKSTNLSKLKDDPDLPFLKSLEKGVQGKGAKMTAEKADIFRKDTVAPVKAVDSVESLPEAIAVSLNETASIDPERIGGLLGITTEEARQMILDQEHAFLSVDEQLIPRTQYLSGNVRAKLRDAEALARKDKRYEKNVEALKKVLPEDVKPVDIAIRPGATWIDPAYYEEFFAYLMGEHARSLSRELIKVHYIPEAGKYSVELTKWGEEYLENSTAFRSEWGFKGRPANVLFEAVLNNQSLKAYTEDPVTGKRVVNREKTLAIQVKMERMVQEFQNWVWTDADRTADLSTIYNNNFNAYAKSGYESTGLTVPGGAPEITPRSHQAAAITRIVQEGKALLDHCVGAGKTYVMAASCMKLRQLGLAKKPMIVAPKSLATQWAGEFLKYFPGAKLLAPGDDFSASTRKKYANMMATGDYDAIIVTYEQFEAIPLAFEKQKAFYQAQIDQLRALMESMGDPNTKNPRKRTHTVKQIARAIDRLTAKLEKLEAKNKRDADNIIFEDTGVDFLFVDEAHNFKNLFYISSLSNVGGLGDPEGAGRSFDMYMKTRWLLKQNNDRGVVFATATPVMNSAVELYTMQRYLQEELLKQLGIYSADAWINQFGDVRNTLEIKPNGSGFQEKQSLSKYKNVPELMQLFRQFADIVSSLPEGEVKVPKMKSGKMILVESEPSPIQKQYIEQLAERAEAVKKGRVDPKEDNMLKITSDGRKAAYSQRMLDANLPYEENGRIMNLVRNVAQIHERTTAKKGTQLIFCDFGTPTGQKGRKKNDATETDAGQTAQLYHDLKQLLIKQGIPENEIAFIHDAKNDEQREQLSQMVNDGTIRVLIGSTGKMSAGLNVQKRGVALHHLDCPWRPGDLEQRNGRYLRQGNDNDEVEVYIYVTNGTFDAKMWDNIQRKAAIINQVSYGQVNGRETEGDGELALSASEIMAITSGNPIIMEQFQVRSELAKLEAEEKNYRQSVMNARDELSNEESLADYLENTLPKWEADAKAAPDLSGDKFSITLDEKTYTKRAEAMNVLLNLAKKYHDPTIQSKDTKVGSFGGLDLFISSSGNIRLIGNAQHSVSVNFDSAKGTLQKLESTLQNFSEYTQMMRERLESHKKNIASLKNIINSKFAKADRLAELRLREQEINEILAPKENETGGFDGDDEDAFLDSGFEDEEGAMLDAEEGDDATTDAAIGDSGPTRADQWRAQRMADNKETVRSLTDLMAELAQVFGEQISVGGIRGKGVLGTHNRRSHGIRLKNGNDFVTAAHEIGHHFDVLYDISDDLTDAEKRELINGAGSAFLSQYKDKKQWPREGIAEFVRQYLTNRELAAQNYPLFTPKFLNTLSEEERFKLNLIADRANAYFSADKSHGSGAVRGIEEKIPDYRSWREKVQDTIDNFRKHMIDRKHGLKILDDEYGTNTHTLALNAAYADNIAGECITGNLAGPGGVIVGEGLSARLHKHGIRMNDKETYAAFGEYLVARNGIERLATTGRRVYADDSINNIAAMQKIVDNLELQYPEFRAAAEEVYDYERSLMDEWLVGTGIISQEQADALWERWQCYVPFRRMIPKTRMRGSGNTGNDANNPIKHFKGSGYDIYNPIDSLITQTYTFISAGMENRTRLAVANAVNQRGVNATFIERWTPPIQATNVDLSGIKEALAEEISGLAGDAATKDLAVAAVMSQIADTITQYSVGKASGNVISVLRNGHREYYKINDPTLYTALLGSSEMRVSTILKAYGRISRMMTGNLTSNDIVWSIGNNALSDIGTALTYTPFKQWGKLLYGIGSTYWNTIANAVGGEVDPLYAEYLAMGGGSTTVYGTDKDSAESVKKKVHYGRLRTLWHFLNPMNSLTLLSDMIERGPRYATYRRLRMGGMSPENAFRGAMDITTDFRIGGDVSQQLNRVFPFFNANVQGVDRMVRYMTAEDTPKSMRAQVAAMRATSYLLSSALIAALFTALHRKDDETEEAYQQTSTFIKNSYYLIPADLFGGASGKFLALRKPRELAVATSFMQALLERFNGDEHAFDDFYQYATDEFMPTPVAAIAQLDLGGLVGSAGVFGTAAYMVANRDFLGRPIESDYMHENLNPWDRYDGTTSKPAYYIGQATKTSPKMWDFFLSSGAVLYWKYIQDLLPMDSSRFDPTLGLRNRYIKDSLYSTDVVNRMYERADASAKDAKADPANIDLAILAKQDATIKTFYGRFNGLAKNETGTAELRSIRGTLIDMLQAEEYSREHNITNSTQEILYSAVRATGETDITPQVMPTYIKDANGIEYSLNYAQYYDYQARYNGYYWTAVEDAAKTGMTGADLYEAIKKGKALAKSKADSYMLNQTGGSSVKNEFEGVPDDKIIQFQTTIKLREDNGESVKQADVIEILEGMNITDAQRYTLFHSKWTSDKNNPWA